MNEGQSSPVLRNRNLVLLWLGQLVSQFGDSVFMIALPWLALDITHSKLFTGLVFGFYQLPFIVFGLAAGAAVDVMNRKRLMLVSDFARALILLCIPLAAWLGVLTGYLLAAVVFVLSQFSAIFNPARDSIIPSLAKNADLVRVNSFIQTSQQLAFLAGPLVAAALLSLFGVIHLFTLDACTFVLSFFLIAAIRYRSSRNRQPDMHHQYRRRMFEGLAFAIREPKLRGLFFITALDNFFIMGPAIVGGAILVKEHLGLDSYHYALYNVFFSTGMILSTAVLAAVGRRLPKGKVMIAGMILDGLTYIPFFWIRSFPVLCGAILVHAMSVSMIIVPRSAIVHQHTPEKYMGRVFSLINITVVGLTALSAAATGIIAEVVPAPMLFLFAGTGGAACGLAALAFRSLRTTR